MFYYINQDVGTKKSRRQIIWHVRTFYGLL